MAVSFFNYLLFIKRIKKLFKKQVITHPKFIILAPLEPIDLQVMMKSYRSFQRIKLILML